MRATLAVTTAVVIVAGCSAEAERPTADPATQSIEMSEVAPVPSSPAPAAASTSAQDSAVAFVRNYLNVLNDAARSPGDSRLSYYTLPECTGCAPYAAAVAALDRTGRRRVAGMVHLNQIRPVFTKDRASVVAQVDEVASSVLDGQRAQVASVPAHPDVVLTFVLRPVGPTWKIAQLSRSESSGPMPVGALT